MDSLICGLIIGTVFYLSSHAGSKDHISIKSIIGSCFALLLYVVYDFVIKPILYSIILRKRRLLYFEDYLKDNGFIYPIYQLNEKVINIYATGVLDSSKKILVGKDLLELADIDTLHGLIWHELGHLKNNHLCKVFIINSICTLLYFILWFKLGPKIYSSPCAPLFVALLGGFLGVVMVIIPEYFRKKYEIQADQFAAQNFGKNNYAGVLNKLNEMTNGGVEKGNVYYPTLKERLAAISN
ncbi:M48 family metallopeptidase [Rhizosphaericola mali]|uniref:M48 family metalloprotease n=1 Tax=Rhizosphaericola mali TaxID=2545455 RepID=A0A5P2FYE6_9BACT|nr:M48 family metalloprotease [Rhizosphaericola mali]QES87408.1 M48 family metalloprotease [Rhizosphaericola mali]